MEKEIKVADVRPEPPMRGERLLREIDGAFLSLNRALHRYLSLETNPIVHSGAVANTAFIIALVSGILLLLWYSPSVYLAHNSVAALTAGTLGNLVRSLHRYSSDGCMLFVLIHALRITAARRFWGSRWIAWISGTFLLLLLWFDGWLGYWLIWDMRSKEIALYSASLLDSIPIFPDLLRRSFLLDSTINSLFFFLVFLVHALIPLSMGVLLWFHVNRLSGPDIFTGRKLTAIILISLVIVSLLFPLGVEAPAQMQIHAKEFPIDLYFMLPFYLRDHLSGGAIWALFFIFGTLLGTIPWTLPKRRKIEVRVIEPRCTGCTQCYQDCPFQAITMVPSTAGRVPLVAQIDPSLCTQCGVCVGACDPGGIVFPLVPIVDSRKHIDTWLRASKLTNPFFAFVCSNSAALELGIDRETGLCAELPGYHVLPVSCTGWIHPTMIERAVRAGAKGILIVGCGPADAYYRKGADWIKERLEGIRHPRLRKKKVSPVPIRYLHYGASDKRGFLEAAAEYRAGKLEDRARDNKFPLVRVCAGLIVAACFLALIVGGSEVAFRPPVDFDSSLVVSFKIPGIYAEQAGAEKSQENVLPHMRVPQGMSRPSRKRLPIRLRVTVDGKLIWEKSYAPSGIFQDGDSMALETFPLQEGKHQIRVDIGETADQAEWTFSTEKTLEFERQTQHVLLFDRNSTFVWE